MLLYYIRHGDPIYDPDSLTPLGEEQAKAVAKRLALHGIDEIYMSSSARAQQTAMPLCRLLKKEPMELDWCNEKYAHRFYGITMEDGKRKFAVARSDIKRLFVSKELRAMGEKWYEHPALADERFAEGEAFFTEHLEAFLAQQGYHKHPEENWYTQDAPNEKRIAIFAHWGVGGVLMSHLLRIPYPQLVTGFGLSHSTVTVVEFREQHGMVTPHALCYGNDSHLYREGLPTRYENRVYL